MSEETTAPAEQDTPNIAAPEVPTTGEGHAAPEVDWTKRYGDLRSEFDRRNDLIARAQQGDAEALSELGFELYDDEPEPEPQGPDEFDPFDPQSVQAYIAQQVQHGVTEALTPFQQEQQQQQVELASVAALHAIDGFESLPQAAQDHVWAIAQQLPPTRDGLYDVSTAYQQFEGLQTELQKRWADSKQRAPRVTSGGQAATEVPDLDDEAARQRYMTEQFQQRSQ